jgi:hypothetical protein
MNKNIETRPAYKMKNSGGGGVPRNPALKRDNIGAIGFNMYKFLNASGTFEMGYMIGDK